MSVFHDLNVQAPAHARTAALQALQRLHFRVVAFNTVIPPSVETLTQVHLPPQQPSHPSLSLLNRITLTLDRPAQLQMLTSSILSSYDIIAVCPTSEKMLHHALQADIDIITLPHQHRPPQVKRPHLHVALDKAIFFEITYAPALNDPLSRRTIIANASALVATVPRQVLLSSAAVNPIHLRGPHDVMNLATLFGLPHQYAHKALTSNAAAVVQHAHFRNNYHKGIVRITTHDS